MKAKKVNIETRKDSYWFYDCEIEFSQNEIAIMGEDVTLVAKVSEITGLRIITED